MKLTASAFEENVMTTYVRENDILPAVALCVGTIDSVATTVFEYRLWVGVYLLLLQLSDGVLRFLEALAGGIALLPHHRQLPLDHIVLLCFLRPRHLTLEQQVRAGGGSRSGVELKL